MMGGLISKVMEGCVTPDVRMSTGAGVVPVQAGVQVTALLSILT